MYTIEFFKSKCAAELFRQGLAHFRDLAFLHQNTSITIPRKSGAKELDPIKRGILLDITLFYNILNR